MVTIIPGKRGAGKTKQLIQSVQVAVEQSAGHVVCIEDTPQLTFDVASSVRLIAAANYGISNYEALFGFLSGICARDHDITDVFVDATLRIGGRDYTELAAFVAKIALFAEAESVKFTFTVSEEKEKLPLEIFSF